MAKQYRDKFITRVHDIIKDFELPHFPDLVMHSKALITMLISSALKTNGASFEFRNDKHTTYEEKLEFMLDNGLISESVYDNCVNALSLRNPIEHIYTYPNEFFAKGAASAALSMYMSLQPKLDLPHIPKAEVLLEDLKIGIPFVFHYKLKRGFEPGEFDVVKSFLEKYKGSYIVLMDFPEGYYFNGKPMLGIQLNEKVQYSELLLRDLTALDIIESVEYAGMEIFPMHPHNADYYDEQYPNLRKPKEGPRV